MAEVIDEELHELRADTSARDREARAGVRGQNEPARLASASRDQVVVSAPRRRDRERELNMFSQAIESLGDGHRDRRHGLAVAAGLHDLSSERAQPFLLPPRLRPVPVQELCQGVQFVPAYKFDDIAPGDSRGPSRRQIIRFHSRTKVADVTLFSKERYSRTSFDTGVWRARWLVTRR